MADEDKHVLAVCDQCGAMHTPVNGEWYACHCGGTRLLYPHAAVKDGLWKETASDRRMLAALRIGTPVP